MEDHASERFSQAVTAYEADEMEIAIELFTALANKGNPSACQYLGMIFKTGDGVAKDFALSDFWYSKHRNLIQKRAMSGDADAMLDLGKLYQYGDNVEVDSHKAFLLIRRAAENGYSNAQFHLANIYRYGWCGCNQDLNNYEYWLDQAIMNDHSEALYLRGMDLARATVTHNMGVEYIRRAAGKNFWPAQEWLMERIKKEP